MTLWTYAKKAPVIVSAFWHNSPDLYSDYVMHRNSERPSVCCSTVATNIYKIKQINHLHTVSRSQQGRLRNLVLKHSIPYFPLNFSRHCLLSAGTQRRAFALMPERKNETLINNNSFPRLGIEPTTVVLQLHRCKHTYILYEFAPQTYYMKFCCCRKSVEFEWK